ncbi:site-specific integrase [Curtobacterium sp. 320]|uniref:site-specific integrase n=1 Tax=Curtobacterium sp. 320 TaxID=2817749 RepID=UPI00286AB883|nr:site-specific integrase [Curtobacterium sp. 320]
MARVRVHRGGGWDVEVVQRTLGVVPHVVPPVTAPVITIDGIVEDDASAWLREVDARTGLRKTKTAITRADNLRTFLHYITAHNTSLRGATNAHIIEYINTRTTGPNRVSGNTIASDRATIRGFYEWLRDERGIPLPITIDELRTANGPVLSMREGRGIPKASAAQTPLEPPQIDELLAAAITRNNGQNYTAARDAAFISLGLACGARADTLAHLLTYELPQAPSSTPRNPNPVEGDLIQMRLPGAVSKTSREVVLPAIRRHLDRVRKYVDPETGGRRLQLDRWKPPANPIWVAIGPTAKFHGIVDTDGIRRNFNTMTADERRRLVTKTGQPAMIFLTVHRGRPLSERTAEEIVADVSAEAERRAAEAGSIFPHVTTHDLRGTYATHLAALFYFGVPTSAGRDLDGRPHRINIQSAVKMASIGLGHIDQNTTQLYIQQVGLMASRYTIDAFLGRTRQ